MVSLLFLSCSLRSHDEEEVNAHFKYLARYYGIETFTINIPGIPDEETIRILKEIIPKVDGVVVLWVPRYPINGWLPSLWTVLEPAFGIMADKPIYVFYEAGIALEGPLKSLGKLRVPFSRWSLATPEEYKRLSNYIVQIKGDIEIKKTGDFWKGVATLGGIILTGLTIFGLGFLIGRASKKD